MPDFKTVIEDFSSTMDALRDFASSVGPVLLQRQDQVSKVVSEKIAPFRIATMLADEASDTGLSDDIKQVVNEVRKLFTGTELKVSPERASRAREEILKILPLKVVEGKIEIDVHHPNTNEVLAQRRVLDKVNREVGLLYESSIMVLASRSEWLIAQLMHIYFGKYPGAAGISEPFFSLGKL
jgi:hypothetical protein